MGSVGGWKHPVLQRGDQDPAGLGASHVCWRDV